MAQEIINVGSSPNDGTGDELRNAFIKTNDNFTEVYTNKEDKSNKSTNTSLGSSDTLYPSQKAVKTYVDTQVATKQNTLVSGTNIKTINGNSILGSGDLTISTTTPTLQEVTDVGNSTTNPILLNNYQPLYAENDSIFINTYSTPDGNAFSSASQETCIGVYDSYSTNFITSRYSKRNIYAENSINTPILAVYNGGKSIDFDITITNVSHSFYLMCKGFVRFDFNTAKYTYKIEWLDEVDATFQSLGIDPNLLNINFDFDSNRFRLKLDNQIGNDLYVNINANIN